MTIDWKRKLTTMDGRVLKERRRVEEKQIDADGNEKDVVVAKEFPLRLKDVCKNSFLIVKPGEGEKLLKETKIESFDRHAIAMKIYLEGELDKDELEKLKKEVNRFYIDDPLIVGQALLILDGKFEGYGNPEEEKDETKTGEENT